MVIGLYGWFLFSSFCTSVLFFLMFICFEREREQEHKQRRGRERGRERIPSRLCTVSTDPDVGLNLTNHELMT